jgi:DNA-binding NtrC family response regulator
VRVGGDREIVVDVRVVAATHRDLEAMCHEGTFRSDLFYRLHGVTIHLPALRERQDEIRPLAEAFLRDACRENGRHVRGIADDALNALVRWRWPGNVRELKNVVERAVVVARGDVVTLADLPERMRDASSGPSALHRTSLPGSTSTNDSTGGSGIGSAQPPTPHAPAPPGGFVPPQQPPYPPQQPPYPPQQPGHPPAQQAGGYAPPPGPADDPSLDYKERLRIEMQRYEKQMIVDALTRANGSVSAAAQALKIPLRTLTHKMQVLGIKKRFDEG